MLDILEKAAIEAGREILRVYRTGPDVSFKSDHSPVTQADERAEAIITDALKVAFPDIPIVAEEAVAAGDVPDISGEIFFLVDPLDGTKEFISLRDDFTVNIALIDRGLPIAGIVYAPALKVAYTAVDGHAAKFELTDDFTVVNRRKIGCRAANGRMVAVASRSHNTPETDRFLSERGITECAPIGSSLKFCLVAEGLADVYPRFSRTMEWDTAAGDAVLRAAGGRVTTANGEPFLYGKQGQVGDSDFANPPFIGWGSGL
ncbi:MAG: 3'(2'),5'-bisphosphate nucleotidase CysQ [Shinella sp.]|nr:3'(2'),5'-bisphosphate nucleotidase CysQ [Shinella sp.]